MSKVDNKDPWMRLVSSARQVSTETEQITAPLGFSSRVTALSLSSLSKTNSLSDILERFSLKALLLCCSLMVIGLTASYLSSQAQNGEEDSYTQTDLVSEMLDMS
jgi:hypothetical protein